MVLQYQLLNVWVDNLQTDEICFESAIEYALKTTSDYRIGSGQSLLMFEVTTTFTSNTDNTGNFDSGNICNVKQMFISTGYKPEMIAFKSI